jgi:hypothetical protein
MNNLSVVILAAMALSGVLLRLLLPRHKSSRTAAAPLHPDAINALPAAKHYGYFTQIRQALSTADTRYLIETAPSRVARQALRERRKTGPARTAEGGSAFPRGTPRRLFKSCEIGPDHRRAFSGSEPRAGNRAADFEPEISISVRPRVAASFHRQFADRAARTSDGISGKNRNAHG